MKKKCNTCKKSKPVDDFYKCGGRRLSSCKQCHIVYQRERRQNGLTKESDRLYRKKHHKIMALRSKKWHDENDDQVKKFQAEYRQTNKDYFKQYRVTNRKRLASLGKRYRTQNSAKYAAHGAARRAIKLRATPKWADKQRIAQLYEQAKTLTKTTGIEHEVDHIIPLQSPYVCGLHCEENLRVITAEENQCKNNRLDMEDE